MEGSKRNSHLSLYGWMLFVASIVAGVLVQSGNGALLPPNHLGVEYLECGGNVPGHVGLRPIGIDKPYPRLQWQVGVSNTSQRAVRQFAYEIQLYQFPRTGSKDPTTAKLVWNIGKIVNNRNLFPSNKYKSTLSLPPLESDSDYYFQVRWYSTTTETSDWSEPGMFSTALMSQAEWMADWITTPAESARGGDVIGAPAQPRTQMVRGVFQLPAKPIARTRLYLTGLGYYQLWQSGAQQHAQRKLGPQTHWPKRVLYDTYEYDVLAGKNVLALRLGPGFWAHDGNPSLWALVQLHITTTDGEEYVVRSHGVSGGCSNSSTHAKKQDRSAGMGAAVGASAGKTEIESTWKFHDDPCTFSDMYLGEHYDAQLEIPHWDDPTLDDRTWLHAYSPAVQTCAVVAENAMATLGCSEPGEVIADVKFASFGTPTGKCQSCTGSGNNFALTTACSADNSTAIVKAQCLGQRRCHVHASRHLFGDPCHLTAKHLSVSVACGTDTRDGGVRRQGDAAPLSGEQLRVSAPSPPAVGELSAQPMTHISSPLEPIQPASVKEVKPHVFVFDFGVNLAGVCIIDYHDTAPGAVISIMKGEELASDGTVHNQLSVNMTTVYVSKGGKVDEAWAPSWVYYGFQYAQVTGLQSADQIKLLMLPTTSALRSHGDVSFLPADTTGRLMTEVQVAIRRTQASNLMSVPTDCPNREKRGWMGDAQVTAPVAMWNYDMAAFYTNWIRTMADVQEAGKTGVVPDIVPGAVGGKTDATWSSAYPLISFYMYQQYGDRELIEQHYAGYKAYVDYLTTTTDAATGLLLYHKYGDWCNMYPRTQEIPTTGPISACFHYMLDIQLLSGFAGLLGNEEDAVKYLQLHNKLVEPFNKYFYNDSIGAYVDGTQTVNLLPIFGKYVPDDVKDKVEANLLDDIVTKHDMHLTTGAVGTRFLLPVVTGLGRPDIAVALANQSTFPSWGHWIMQGATSLWENWSGVADETHPPAPTHDHIFLGSHGSWLYEVGLGIKPKMPGFEQIIIRPPVTYFNNQTIGQACRESEGSMLLDLEGAQGTYDSVRGPISVTWSQQKPDADHTVFTLHVDIPVNTNASVYLPQRVICTSTLGESVFPPAENVTIYEGNNLIWINNFFHWPGAPGITGGGMLGLENAIVFEVGSGHYDFQVREVN
ncbi:alpha-L-rhamnosidase-like [Sycon ciliatum]|uniref:alpha-L-rhamnosidase-like n=1 Tax=Sycon ciliatum TaxID=27933 RepID=UPI0031F60FC2